MSATFDKLKQLLAEKGTLTNEEIGRRLLPAATWPASVGTRFCASVFAESS